MPSPKKTKFIELTGLDDTAAYIRKKAIISILEVKPPADAPDSPTYTLVVGPGDKWWKVKESPQYIAIMLG